MTGVAAARGHASLCPPYDPRQAVPASRADVEIALHFVGHRDVFCEVRRDGRLIGATFGATVREVLAEAEDLIEGAT